MMSLAIIILSLMPPFAHAHQEPAQGGVCHYFAKNKLHCHYNYRTEDLLLLPEEPPTDEQETVSPETEEEVQEEEVKKEQEKTEQEESVKDPLEERRKSAARQCLDALKQSCRRLSLGDACIWTARFACEQTLLDAVPVADQKDIDDFIAQEKHLWENEEEVAQEEQDTDIVDDILSLF